MPHLYHIQCLFAYELSVTNVCSRRMERELPLSAIDSNRGGRSRPGPSGSSELPMLFHLAMVNEHDSTRECRGYGDRPDSAKCDSHQSFSPGPPIRTDHSRIRSGAER